MQLTLSGLNGVPEGDRDYACIERVEQDHLRVRDKISEIESQIVQNKNALVVHENNLKKVTKPTCYRMILNYMESLQNETQDSILLNEKIADLVPNAAKIKK